MPRPSPPLALRPALAPLVALALALALAGCAAPGDDAGAGDPGGNATRDGGEMAPEPEAIQVVVGEGGVGAPPRLYTISPARLELVAGQAYNLTLKNNGRLGHDLVIEGLDVEIDTVPAGGTSEGVVFTPTEPGTYPMYCTIGGAGPTGHRSQGMAGEVVVT